MTNKVILISIDGMRPDGFTACGHPFAEEMRRIGAWTLDARTVLPSVTLPCHMSMFHSVTPERHGVTVNQYQPMARPLNGLFEQIKLLGGRSAMYYGWEQLRDVARPGSLKYAEYLNARCEEDTDRKLTEAAMKRLAASDPDFTFLYLVETDEKGGHDNGWMSDEYLRRISIAIDNVKRVIDTFGDEYSVIVMADHGGHDRSHGSTLPEDMIIPLFFYGSEFLGGKEVEGISLLDIAPTIAHLMGIEPEKEWEGHSVI